MVSIVGIVWDVQLIHVVCPVVSDKDITDYMELRGHGYLSAI